MRAYRLTAAVFTEDSDFLQLVQRVRPPEGCTLQVVSSAQPEASLAQNCQVLVWDLPGSTPGQARALCGANTLLVFRVGQEALETLPPASWQEADLLWPVQGPDAVALHSLERLLLQYRRERTLRISVTSLKTTLDSLPDMVWFKSLDGTHVWVNRAFCSVVGKPREDVIGRDHCYIWGVSPDDPDSGVASCQESEDAVIAAGHTLQSSEQVKGSTGLRQLTIYKSPLYDEDGTVLGTTGVGRDITSLENMSTQIDILLQGMPYAVLLRDAQGLIFEANRRFESDFGLTKQQIVGQRYDLWAQDAFFPQRTKNGEGFLEGVTCTGRRMELRKENIYNIFNEVVGQVCIFRDVTAERQMEAQIIQNATTDFLTGLHNRRALYEYVHQNCKGQPISLFFLDLDHFKDINDIYGHDAGDSALILTARFLRESCPQDFVARMGGDEFLVVKLGDISIAGLEQEANALLQRLQDTFSARPNLSRLSASIGISQSCSSECDIEELIRQSDNALYAAKDSGRSCCRVYRKNQ